MRDHWPELLVALGFVSGWGLVTWGLAELLTPWVWPLSGGALCLSLVGWRLIRQVIGEGLYKLSVDERGKS